MKKLLLLLALIIVAGFTACTTSNNSSSGDDTTPPTEGSGDEENYPFTLGPDDFVAHFTETPPVIDGIANDAAWEKAKWQYIKYEWMNSTPPNITPVKSPEDFSGRFKIVWTADKLYILAEIIDDVKSITRQSTPYTNPENDDCLELFIDENASGGARSTENGSNFFTYHMSFGGKDIHGRHNVADYVGGAANNSDDPDLRIENGTILRNSHLNYVIGEPAANTYLWEAEMKVYNNTYPARGGPSGQTPVTLTENKKMGFAVAYCDADAKNTREHFIGSMFVTGNTDNERNVSYLNSSQYAKLYLVK